MKYKAEYIVVGVFVCVYVRERKFNSWKMGWGEGNKFCNELEWSMKTPLKK